MASQIKLRRGTAAQWTSANPVLAQGEAGFETDTYKLKIGNGSSAWTALAYFNPDLSAYLTQSSASTTYLTQTSASTTYATKTELTNLIDGAPETLNTLNELAAALGDNADILSLYLTASSASTTYATKAELNNIDALPSQTGNSGKYLTTDGTNASWSTVTSGGGTTTDSDIIKAALFFGGGR